MRRVDSTVKRETGYIFLFSLLLSVFMQAVFLAFRFWDITVLLGGILGLLAATLHFFLMGLFLQIALEKQGAEAKNRMRFSQTVRTFLLLFVSAMAYFSPYFSLAATVIPYLFPRIAVTLRILFTKKRDRREDTVV